MRNLYNELMIVEELLEYSIYNLDNLRKYYYDIVDKSFKSEVDYEQEGVCLDNMMYPDYSGHIAKNLRSIVSTINQEIEHYNDFYQGLVNLRKQLINKLMVISVLPAAELMDILELFGYPVSIDLFAALRYIHVFTLRDGNLELSEELCMNFPEDVIEFIIFYVNAKSGNLKETVNSIYSNYQELKHRKTL